VCILHFFFSSLFPNVEKLPHEEWWQRSNCEILDAAVGSPASSRSAVRHPAGDPAAFLLERPELLRRLLPFFGCDGVLVDWARLC
jgi:hypothetical protein